VVIALGSRVRLGLAAVLLVVAIVDGGCSAGAAARSIASPGCSTAVASAPVLSGVRTTTIGAAGYPFGVATTPDGRWTFLDEFGAGLAVFSDSSAQPRLVRTIQLPVIVAGGAVTPTIAAGNALTADGRYLLVADTHDGAVVVSVARAETGSGNPVLGTLARPGSNGGARTGVSAGAVEVTSSPEGRYAFVSLEGAASIAVYDLQAALADHFSRSSYVGSVSLGRGVVGVAVSPDGRWLYATSELAATARSASAPGTLSVIRIATAERDPARAVIANVDAGCQPVRVITSSDGQTVWVTARASDDLLAFSAARLISDPQRAMLAAVRVGEAPVGLTLVRGGSLVVVADSNRFNAPGAHGALSVVNAAAALAGRPAVLGTIPIGGTPKEMSLEPNGRTLLVSNSAPAELHLVDVSALP
jgi:DNA-binding beta-propeller fold protein YncE